ncbi:MBL fold metallo-hydrolase [Paenibacillus sp. LMG 31461]|uniref:MBL fold metallo-hydrolase n=1 Tax=Paenibacillus plantarum TaxID=2654975 RepID=A0ABX1XJU8_9BACL|nr:MBL fold metallo-hydrolase [Paenibacillus plantarum]NOU68787.1 MBL fold metallo-hydrolase [Paenibacillus plantarum]
MELYAIKFGESSFRLRHIYRDMPNSEETTKIAWSYYIAKFNDITIAIDTGFRDENVAKKWGITFTGVEQELSSIIDNLAVVDMVIITHSHFDHIENLDLYGKPEIIISKTDYENALQQCSHSIIDKLNQCHVVTVENEYIYNDLLRFRVIGGHSKGSSVVYFEADNKHYVITGDECYWCDNLISNRPIGVYASTQNNERFIIESQRDKLIPLPFHDLNIFEQYSNITNNIVRIL